jgi:hypothetical protein
VVDLPHMTAAKETTLKEVGEMLTHVVTHMATKENLEAVRSELKGDIADIRKTMVTKDYLREELAPIHAELKSIMSLFGGNDCPGPARRGSHKRLGKSFGGFIPSLIFPISPAWPDWPRAVRSIWPSVRTPQRS